MTLKLKDIMHLVMMTSYQFAYTIYSAKANPLTTPTVQPSGTIFPWVENTRGVLRCTTTPGNPPEVTYDWLQNGQVINGQTTDTYTIPTLSNVHNRLHIQCRVSNMYTRNRPPPKVSNITVLDVQCKYKCFNTIV
ncbi:hypothetical protein KUTeg_006486 [Tegillarca granosa]|uniref:Ig-like domain-containing protein n=1 Tax=Tegillarca granosa TaxID=220873 RepID=A0ABQ9FIT9_TEGGR|nr:hypothetical protein KUTeg_006486 [Tegillarca granosa]